MIQETNSSFQTGDIPVVCPLSHQTTNKLHTLEWSTNQKGLVIIGVTGPIASGKNVFSEMLVERGFVPISLSEEVREECKKRGIAIERKNLQDFGNKMRKLNGTGYWAKRLVAKMQEGKHYVIEGIRNPGEIEEFRKMRNFVLIGVDAPIEDRIKWIKARKKDSDPKTVESIRAMDARDRGIGEGEEGQQSWACFQMADAYIYNNTTLEDLKEKAQQLADELGC